MSSRTQKLSGENSPRSPQSEVDRFRVLLETYQVYADLAGTPMVAYRNRELPNFTALDLNRRQGALFALETAIQICDRTIRQGAKLSDSPALTWSALKQFGFRPPSDLFDHVNQECVIEIHSSTGIQLFRNFNFYRYCSYSIEELYCIAWYDLFEREERITGLILEAAANIFSSRIQSTFPMDIPGHRVKERFSPYKYEVNLKMKWGAPLFHADGSPEASIVVETATFMQSQRPSLPREDPSRPIPQPLLRLED